MTNGERVERGSELPHDESQLIMPIQWSEEEANRERDEITVSCSLPASSSHEEITAGAKSPPADSEPMVARHTGDASYCRLAFFI